MLREDIMGRLQEIFQDLLDDDDFIIAEDMSRKTIKDWDSLFHMTLMATVSGEFNIQIKTEDITHINDVAGLVDLIQGLIG